VSRSPTPLTQPSIPLPAADDPVWRLGLERVRLLHEWMVEQERPHRRRSRVFG
jgi:hypothetical protein